LLPERAIDDADSVCVGIWRSDDDTMEGAINEVGGCIVVEGDAGGDVAGLKKRLIARATCGLGVVVGAAAASKEAEAVERAEAVCVGVDDGLLEPAVGAGAAPG
jgi:hypothetical protein